MRDRKAKDASGQTLRRKFELIEPIAWGGTAAVYKARNLETKALCAVKLLYPGAREDVGDFFGQEARLAARIRSPHLVHASAFGEDRGRLYIVFDLVPGKALAALHFEAPMPWRELLRVVLQVLDALEHLHRRGIVHRDVKPDNVIVENRLGGEVHVTLLDFGFAWVPPERRLTVAPDPSQMVYGTDGFIAPELFAGWVPDARNDLYSVGALMFSKLAGHGVPDVSAAPELMVLPSPRAFVPSIPEEVDDIVMRALSDIEVRFQSAEEMAAAIREVMVAADRSEFLMSARGTDTVPSRPASQLAGVEDAAGSSRTLALADASGAASPTEAEHAAVLSSTPVGGGGTASPAEAEHAVRSNSASIPVDGGRAASPTEAEGAPGSSPTSVTEDAGVVTSPRDVEDAAESSPALDSVEVEAEDQAVAVARPTDIVLPPVGELVAEAESVVAFVSASCVGGVEVVAGPARSRGSRGLAALVLGSMVAAAALAALHGRPEEGDVGSSPAVSAASPMPLAQRHASVMAARAPPAPCAEAENGLVSATMAVAKVPSADATGTTAIGPPGTPAIDPPRTTAIDPPPPRRSASKPRSAASFEQVMGRLEAKARQCARGSELAEEPLEVQVIGAGGAIKLVRVVNLGAGHAFTRCIDAVVRSAAPPLGEKPLQRHTFFSRKR